MKKRRKIGALALGFTMAASCCFGNGVISNLGGMLSTVEASTSSIVYNPSTGENGGFTVKANKWSKASSNAVVYNGMVLDVADKVESSTKINFTSDSKGTLVLVFNEGSAGKSILVDGESYEIPSSGVVTASVGAGDHEVLKDSGSSYLYYMEFTGKGGSVETTEATTEETTETTTKEKSEDTTSSNIEGSGQLTTIALEEFSENPTDAQGQPLTGKDLAAYKVVAKTYKDKWTAKTSPVISETTLHSDADYTEKAKTFTFDSGDKFTIKRFTFNTNDDARLEDSITIEGNTMQIRYVSPETNEWYMSENLVNTAKQTMFIDTDKGSYIFSVPGVYTNSFENNTLEMRPELEQKIEIEKGDGTYTLKWSFPRNTETIGEIWMLQSANKLADWSNINHFNTLKQDLGINRRFSWDGYYFPTPSNYTPYSPTMLYRQPSDYSGASFTKYGSFPAPFELGYVFTYTCMGNQNTDGYWPTGPKSGWLATDFNIAAGFYDTRFNTDFGCNLIDAYKRYNNTQFLMAACKYAEFFLEHAEKNSYVTTNGGLLVEDYGYKFEHTKTHISLNHQLAEMNYLYRLYNITKEERYKEMADRMLKGVEDTKDQWVLANNNLNYALYYLANTNTMVDYPYLTYNDLKEAQELYMQSHNNAKNETLQYLMDCKMEWMLANGVTGYNK